MPGGTTSCPVAVMIYAAIVSAASAVMAWTIEDPSAVQQAVRQVAEGTDFFSGKLLPLNVFGALGGAFFSLIFELYISRACMDAWRLSLKFFAQPILACVFTPVVIRCLPWSCGESDVVAVSFVIGASGIWFVKFAVDHFPSRFKRVWDLWWRAEEQRLSPQSREPEDK